MMSLIFLFQGIGMADQESCPSVTITYKNQVPMHGRIHQAQIDKPGSFSSFFQQSGSSSSSMEQITLGGQSINGSCQYENGNDMHISMKHPLKKGCRGQALIHLNGRDFVLDAQTSGFGCTYSNESVEITMQPQ